MKIIDNINSKDYGDEAAYHQIETDLNILQTDERSCFSETSECFTKDELLLYLEMTTTVEATS